MGMTPMISPDGSTGEIPTTRVGEAVKNGFKIGAKLTSPDGRTGAVPLDRVHDAIKAGFSPYVESESNANPVAPVPLPGATVVGTSSPGHNVSVPSPLKAGGMQVPKFGDIAELAAPETLAASVVGKGGTKLGEYIGEKSKLSPSEIMWAGRIGGVLGAFAGAGGVSQAESIWGGIKQSFASKLYNAEGELTAFGKTLVHPTSLPENAIKTIFPPPTELPSAGTGASLPSSAEFYENRAADLMKRTGDVATEGQQGGGAAASQPSASEFYENRAANLAGRTGDVNTEGQQGGGAAASQPSASEFYENRAANLAGRTGDVNTEGQQGGGFGGSLPAAPTSEEQLARAIKQGNATKIPARIPKSATASAKAADASKYYSSGGGISTAPENVGTMPPATQIGAQEGAATGPVTTTGPAARIVTGRMQAQAPPGSLQEAVQQATPQPGIVAPGSAPPPIKGSFWSYPESELSKAVLAGDREAAIVYRMRFNSLPKGASYLNDVSESVIKGLYKSTKGSQ